MTKNNVSLRSLSRIRPLKLSRYSIAFCVATAAGLAETGWHLATRTTPGTEATAPSMSAKRCMRFLGCFEQGCPAIRLALRQCARLTVKGRPWRLAPVLGFPLRKEDAIPSLRARDRRRNSRHARKVKGHKKTHLSPCVRARDSHSWAKPASVVRGAPLSGASMARP
jgi:hypothetical protein